MKTVLQRSMSWPAKSTNLNPIEHLWWKLKKMIHDKAPTCQANLAKAIRENWRQIDEEFCLSLIKSMPLRLPTVKSVATKYQWLLKSDLVVVFVLDSIRFSLCLV